MKSVGSLSVQDFEGRAFHGDFGGTSFLDNSVTGKKELPGPCLAVSKFQVCFLRWSRRTGRSEDAQTTAEMPQGRRGKTYSASSAKAEPWSG
jgi:hypothetical protein